MKLEKLSLTHFRQFRDDEVEFATGNQNITVIRGANGSGKTTLLQAFRWVLFGDSYVDVQPENLATEGVMAEGTVGDEIEVAVTLDFTHEKEAYTTTRRLVIQKESENDLQGRIIDHELTVRQTSTDQNETIRNPRSFHNTILPEHLSKLFFFDGESANKHSIIEHRRETYESIMSMMGLTSLERARRHLDHVAGVFEDEFAELGSEELRKLVTEKNELQTERDQLEEKYDETQRELPQLEAKIADINEKLGRLEETQQLHERRTKHVQRRAEANAEVESITDRIRLELDERAIESLAVGLLYETAVDLDEMRRNEESTPTSTADLCAEGTNSAAHHLTEQLNHFFQERATFINTVTGLFQSRKKIKQEIIQIQQHIDNVSEELTEYDFVTNHSLSELEHKRTEKEARREKIREDAQRLAQKIDQTTERIDDLKNEISNLNDLQETALTARRRQLAAATVADSFHSAYDNFEQLLREVIEEETQETLNTVSTKELDVELTDQFQLSVSRKVSTGSVEVTKAHNLGNIELLAFIISLLKIAYRRHKSKSSKYATGGVYPLVLDSPFVALDSSCRQELAGKLSALSSQVIVFVTDAQWQGTVEEEMTADVGLQYGLDPTRSIE